MPDTGSLWREKLLSHRLLPSSWKRQEEGLRLDLTTAEGAVLGKAECKKSGLCAQVGVWWEQAWNGRTHALSCRGAWYQLQVCACWQLVYMRIAHTGCSRAMRWFSALYWFDQNEPQVALSDKQVQTSPKHPWTDCKVWTHSFMLLPKVQVQIHSASFKDGQTTPYPYACIFKQMPEALFWAAWVTTRLRIINLSWQYHIKSWVGWMLF